MTPKPHIAHLDDPPREGSPIQVLCVDERTRQPRVVERPKIVMVWDEALMGQDWRHAVRFGTVCRKCLQSPAPNQSRYVCAVMDERLYGAKEEKPYVQINA